MKLHKNFRLNIRQVMSVLIICLFFSQISKSETQNLQGLSDSEAVMQLTGRYNAKSTTEEKIYIARMLSNYHYHEIVGTLMTMIVYELNSGNANRLVITTAIHSLGQIITNSYAADIRNLQQFLDAQRFSGGDLSDNTQFSIIKDSLKNLEHDALLTRGVLPKLKDAPAVKKVTVTTETPLKIKESTLQEKISEFFAKHEGEKLDELDTFVNARPDYLTDEVLEDRANDDSYKIVGREKEANEAIDVLVRTKGKNPVFVGPRGAGKTSITMKIAETILDKAFPQSEAHIAEFKNAFVISTTPGKISMMALSDSKSQEGAAMESYLESIHWVEKNLNVKIILYIDEIHTLNEGQIEAMKPFLDSKKKAIRLIGSSTSVEMQNAFKKNPAFLRRLQQIGVYEQSYEEVLEIVKKTKLPQIQKKFNTTIDEDALEVIIKSSPSIYPDKSQVDAAVTIVEDIAIAQLRKSPTQQKTGLRVTEKIANEFIQSKLKFPVDVRDAIAMHNYKTDLQQSLSQVVIGQDRMIDDVTNEWLEVLMGAGDKGVRTIALLGPTGTGKSLLGREFSKKVYGHEGAFLEIDANAYKHKGDLSTLFGVSPGWEGAQDSSGQLFDYLDDPGRGKFGGVILINEGERAIPEFWERWMEIMDTGKGTAADGIERKLRKHLIIITSNRGDRIVYPPSVEKWSEQEIAQQMSRYNSEELKKLFTQKTSGEDKFILPAPILARIDLFSLAAPITKRLATRVAQSKLANLIKDLEKRYKIKISADPKVSEALAESAYVSGMGTRPVEKAVNRLFNKVILSALLKMGLKKNEALKVDVVTNGNTQSLRAQTSRQNVTEELPTLKPKNKMDDPEYLTRLKNLEPTLGSRVIGQTDAIHKLSDATIAFESKSENSNRPLAFFLIGSTGTGKTEFAKALAEALYGNSERAAVISLGQVKNEHHLSDIFGSSKGLVGSTDLSLFEQALINNPDGGVIVFDEASNMGGNDPAKKNELFKTFYEMLDEGKWTSKVTNKTYDLGKFKFIFTGNDGEKLFQGMSAEDMRLAAWEKSKNPKQVRSLLREAGVPEAFLGRMVELILYKPLLKSEIKKIADKLISGALKPYVDDGIKFEFAKDFFEKTADAFFTSDAGARSIRNIADSQISSLVAKAIVQLEGQSKLKNHTIRFSVHDNKTPKTYVTAKTPERQVIITAEILNSKKSVVARLTLDATDYANSEIKQSPKNALATSYHEAGHAIMNDPKITGQKLSYITIRGGKLSNGKTYLGYARYEDATNDVFSAQQNEKMIIYKAAQLLAGQMGQQLAGYGADAGWSNDLEETRKLISHYLIKWGLVNGLKALRVDKDGDPILNRTQNELLDKNIERVYAEAEALAKKYLTQNWNFVRAVVGELIHKGSVDEARYLQLQKSYAKSRLYSFDEEKDRLVLENRLKAKPSTTVKSCSALFKGK